MNCHLPTLLPITPAERLPTRRHECAGSLALGQQGEAPLLEIAYTAHVRTPVEHTPFRITPEASVLDLSKTLRDEAISERQTVFGGGVLLGAERLESLFKGDMSLDCIDLPSCSSVGSQGPSSSTFLPNRISLSERRSCLTEHKRRKSKWVAAMALLLVLYLGYPAAVSNSSLDPNSVYVSGGGFSGFWFWLPGQPSFSCKAQITFPAARCRS